MQETDAENAVTGVERTEIDTRDPKETKFTETGPRLVTRGLEDEGEISGQRSTPRQETQKQQVYTRWEVPLCNAYKVLHQGLSKP